MNEENELVKGKSYLIKVNQLYIWDSGEKIVKVIILNITDRCYECKWENKNKSWELKTSFNQELPLVKYQIIECLDLIN